MTSLTTYLKGVKIREVAHFVYHYRTFFSWWILPFFTQDYICCVNEAKKHPWLVSERYEWPLGTVNYQKLFEIQLVHTAATLAYSAAPRGLSSEQQIDDPSTNQWRGS